MAFKISTLFGAPVLSFDLMDNNLGLFQPGRYRGFDTVEVIGGTTSVIPGGQITIRYSHNTGVRKFDKLGNYLGKTGIALTPQGSVISETITDSQGWHQLQAIAPTTAPNNGNLGFTYLLLEFKYTPSLTSVIQPRVYVGPDRPNPLGTISDLDKFTIVLGIIHWLWDPLDSKYSYYGYTPESIPNMGGEPSNIGPFNPVRRLGPANTSWSDYQIPIVGSGDPNLGPSKGIYTHEDGEDYKLSRAKIASLAIRDILTPETLSIELVGDVTGVLEIRGGSLIIQTTLSEDFVKKSGDTMTGELRVLAKIKTNNDVEIDPTLI